MVLKMIGSIRLAQRDNCSDLHSTLQSIYEAIYDLPYRLYQEHHLESRDAHKEMAKVKGIRTGLKVSKTISE